MLNVHIQLEKMLEFFMEEIKPVVLEISELYNQE